MTVGDDRAVLPAERRRQLVRLLDDRGAVRVRDLAETLSVSAATVRRDLADLHRQGRVVRVHGGAGASEAAVLVAAEPAHAAAKQAIGRAAAALVDDGMTIMLLSGSTTAAMVPYLAGRAGLTVVTNGLDVAHAVAHTTDDIAVMIVGGLLHRSQMTMIGAVAEQTMQAVHVDQMFGGAWGVDASVGATGPKLIQGGRRDLLQHTDSLVVLADGSKIGRRGPARLAEPGQISCVITDRSAPPHHVEQLRAAGLRVEVCR